MKQFVLPILLLIVFLDGCCGIPKYVVPNEFRKPEQKSEFIKSSSSWLTGKRIFIDPGHGGNDRSNKGFGGNTIEADANLNVALELRKLLIQSGAEVILSRDKDTTVDLRERSILANNSMADFFISIHHNATGNKEDIWTNYTATYYHAQEDDTVFEQCQKDLAKFIQRDLSYAMRNSGGPGSFDGTYSDYSIYPGQGFSVLRLTRIPAVLVECGFTTSEYESGLITLNEFNSIEAWGIFKGICQYLRSGVPQIKYYNTEKSELKDTLNIIFSLKDSSGIRANSLILFIDSYRYDSYNLNKKMDTLSIQYPAANIGKHLIKIICANINGNYSLPFYYNFIIPNKKDK